MAAKLSGPERKKTLQKVLSRISRYRLLVILSIVLAALSVALTLYIPILVGRAIDAIVGQGRVDFDRLLDAFARVAAAAGLTALCQWVMNDINNRITCQVVRDIRDEAFRKLMILPLSYLDARPVGETVSRVISDVDQFSEGLLLGFTQLFTGVVTIGGTLLFMLSVHPGITLVVVVLTPLSLFVARFIARRTYSMFRAQSEARAEQTALVEEMIGGMKVVKAFSRERAAGEAFARFNEKLRKASLKAIFYSSITNPSTRFINSLVYAGVGLTGALAALSGSITVGGLSAFLSYANQYTKPFNEISGVIAELQNALVCASRIFELIGEEPQVPDDKDARVLTEPRGRVDIKNVSFSYVPERPLIEGLSLAVKPGERVAIVGPTGCGKTTLINLLMRFYDVDGGEIDVEGTDIRRITRRSLRANYGMVLQDTWIKAGTVRENIAMGRPEAGMEEIEAAARAAHAHGFISRLPQGYDTVLSGDGGSLSQGQKQLLCIARVMLNLPPMLILDEATSSIDTRTEMRIQAAFAHMMRGRTSFIVAHRLSTIQNADVILVMRDGHIVEQGTHRGLLNLGGFYSKLYHSQFEQ